MKVDHKSFGVSDGVRLPKPLNDAVAEMNVWLEESGVDVINIETLHHAASGYSPFTIGVRVWYRIP